MRSMTRFVLVACVALIGLVAFASARQQEQPKMPPPNPNAGFLGAKFSPVTDELADQLKLDTQDGVVIVEIVPDSPAEKAGLHQGDLIRQIDGKKVDDIQAFVGIMRETRPDQQLKLAVMREGKMQDISVTLGKRPAEMNQPPSGGDGHGEHGQHAPATGPATRPGE